MRQRPVRLAGIDTAASGTIPNPSACSHETMLWLEGTPRLWAMLHRPCDASGNPVEAQRAVIFCPPFAEEEKCSRRLYVELARELARRGIASLRLSYGGTGDSEGDFSACTVESSLADIRRGLDYLRDQLGISSLATFGLRLGATLALESVHSFPGIERVALWAPITNGRSYVRMNIRRKSIRKMMNTGAADDGVGVEGKSAVLPSSQETDVSSEDIFDFDGYPVANVMWKQIESLQCIPPEGWNGKVLVISVGAGSRPTPDCANLASALTDIGVETQLEYVVAQPFWNLLGLVECPEIIEKTAQWLADS